MPMTAKNDRATAAVMATDVLPPASGKVWSHLASFANVRLSILPKHSNTYSWGLGVIQTIVTKYRKWNTITNPNPKPNLTNPIHSNWHRIACITRCRHCNASDYTLNYTVGIAALQNNFLFLALLLYYVPVLPILVPMFNNGPLEQLHCDMTTVRLLIGCRLLIYKSKLEHVAKQNSAWFLLQMDNRWTFLFVRSEWLMLDRR